MNKVFSEYTSSDGAFSFHHSLSVDNTKLNPQAHKQFEFLYLLKGEIKYYIEGEEYLVNSGDAIFVSPNQIHSLQANPKYEFERITVMFDIETIGKMLSVGGMKIDKESFSDTSCYRVIPKAMLEVSGIKKHMLGFLDYEKEKTGDIFVLTKILNLIMGLEKIFEETERGHVPSRVDHVVKAAVDYIDKNICSSLTLDSICAAVFVSKSTLCHKFVKAMHISINRFVAIKKVHYASKLMRQGMGAIEAGMTVGYKQYTTFYHNYKQIVGCSPADAKFSDN